MKQTKTHEDKPQFSGHQTFPLRQLWLKKAYTAIKSANSDGAPKSIFTDDDSIVRFGVGKNMVQSINHWALAAGFVVDDNNLYKPTSVAEILFGENGLDLYQESVATSWLIHWNIAGEAKKTTTWSWLFNQTKNPILDKDLLLESLKIFAEQLNYNVSVTTLKRDLDCCIRTYIPADANETPEERSESVLGEIDILRRISRGKYEFVRGEKTTLPNSIFIYALIKFWERSQYSDQNTMSFNNIVHADNSPGRVFKLDELSIAERLSCIEDETEGKMIWTDSQGIRSVSRKVDKKIEADDILRKAYG